MANREWLEMQEPISSNVEFVTHAKMGRVHQCAPEMMPKNDSSAEQMATMKFSQANRLRKFYCILLL
jgi:hypothetical protein